MKFNKKNFHHKRPKVNKIVRVINGFPIRSINPDFDIINWRKDGRAAPICDIPKNQIWIDERFIDEEAFLLKLYLAEQKYEAEHGSDFKESVFRAFLKKEFTWPGERPSLADLTVRKRRQGRFLIRFVDGSIVRQWIDPWFSFGGHHLIYDYVPCDEIWIDAKQHPKDAEYTLAHEIREWWLMGRGLPYHEAHDLATKYEKILRVRDMTSKHSHSIMLHMKSHWQEKPGSCGPASAKILLQYSNKNWSEKVLRQMCGTNSDGTNHYPLIRGLRKTGATVSVKSNATIDDIKKFLQKDMPVLIGMWSPELGELHFDSKWNLNDRRQKDCGHYSVVCGISDRQVTIMDPDNYWIEKGNKTGRRRMSIGAFLNHWYDTDGKNYKQVKAWMLVINFSDKQFKGMKNYSPKAKSKKHND